MGVSKGCWACTRKPWAYRGADVTANKDGVIGHSCRANCGAASGHDPALSPVDCLSSDYLIVYPAINCRSRHAPFSVRHSDDRRSEDCDGREDVPPSSRPSKNTSDSRICHRRLSDDPRLMWQEAKGNSKPEPLKQNRLSQFDRRSKGSVD